jgi:hypothetical protein
MGNYGLGADIVIGSKYVQLKMKSSATSSLPRSCLPCSASFAGDFIALVSRTSMNIQPK